MNIWIIVKNGTFAINELLNTFNQLHLLTRMKTDDFKFYETSKCGKKLRYVWIPEWFILHGWSNLQGDIT